MKEHVIHPIKPIYNIDSKVLVLGSMPSPKSREIGLPYSHPQNKFWRIMFEILDTEFSTKNEDRISLLIKHKIALWDVIKSCDINGASDASITNVVVNDLKSIVDKSNITHIFTTGKTAYNLYMKYIFPCTKIEAFLLPSTSPANASKTYNEIKKEYSNILEYL